jgi:hypothetical protein
MVGGKRNIILLVFLFVVMAAVAVLFSTTPEPAEPYFSANTLPRSAVQQYFYLKDFIVGQPAEQFQGYEPIPQRQWKFQLAFYFYATACMLARDPSFDPDAPSVLRQLIRKYLSRPVWEDWLQDGYGKDPFRQHNMMYRGHLALMLILYEYVTGRTEFAALADSVILRLHQEASQNPMAAVLCEPDNYYIACNSVGQLAFLFYDRLRRTELSAIRHRWLASIQESLQNAGTGLLATVFHPSSRKAAYFQSARHNGWDIVFLSAIDPVFSRDLYRNYRRQIIRSFAGFAWAARKPGGWWPDGGGSGFAMAAAHAAGDRITFRKFLRSLQALGRPVRTGEKLHYKRSNLLGDAILLFAKVVCFRELLEKTPPILR